MKRTLATVFLCIMVAAPAWADIEKGKSAFERGDYRTALIEFRLLAEKGNAEAQNQLGYMYENGIGTSIDFAKARNWYLKSAKKGLKSVKHVNI